jgi:hypothetical protein
LALGRPWDFYLGRPWNWGEVKQVQLAVGNISMMEQKGASCDFSFTVFHLVSCLSFSVHLSSLRLSDLYLCIFYSIKRLVSQDLAICF